MFVYNFFVFQGEYQAAVDIYDEEVQNNIKILIDRFLTCNFC